MKKNNILWITEDGIELTKKDLTQEEFADILKYIALGGGNKEFLTKEKIDMIFQYAYKTKAYRPDIILNYQTWAYYWNFCGKKPCIIYLDNLHIKRI